MAAHFAQRHEYEIFTGNPPLQDVLSLVSIFKNRLSRHVGCAISLYSPHEITEKPIPGSYYQDY